jgi:hypothetical protein
MLKTGVFLLLLCVEFKGPFVFIRPVLTRKIETDMQLGSYKRH